MEKNLEVLPREPQALTPQLESESVRMFAMIERMMTDPSCDPEKLRALLSVKQSWETDEARKAFSGAMADFQSRCPIIAKGDSANGRAFARIDRIHRETRPILKECGLWFAWTVCEEREGGLIYLEGILGHARGHQVPLKQLISLPDKISGTNAAQRAGSGQTYAKRYGELAALNIVTGDDTDGGAKERPKSPAAQVESKPVKVAPAPVVDDSKALLKQVWDLVKPMVSLAAGWDSKTWNGHNDFLFRADLLDGGIPEVLPDLTPDRLRKLIADIKAKI